MPEASHIIYTKTDEAPALATLSLLPILQAFTKGSGIELKSWDISLTGRIISNFPDSLTDAQKSPDYLALASALCLDQAANIIKLPNISASIPQLKNAIKELQDKGYAIPDYPDDPRTDKERELHHRFSRVLGSSVNPALREGNSDRRSSISVREYGKRNPHRLMKDWPTVSHTRVSHMTKGDFYGSEQAVTVAAAGSAVIEFVACDGGVTELKTNIPLMTDEIIDCTVMNVKALRQFYDDQMQQAKSDDLLLSLHLKSTMMRVSDPIMFGHCVSIYYKDVLTKHAAVLRELGVNPDNGMAELYTKIQSLPKTKCEEIEADIRALYSAHPKLSMVDSSRGITNLHVPSDVIIDASMPVIIRNGGRSWGPDNELHDTIAMIPDRSYATIYQAIIEDCQKNGAFDPSTIGSVSNVGLMAQKAEEYGSHDKTFKAPSNGTIRVANASGTTLMEQSVEEGDIFRMCQTKDESIQDWVKLAVNRARATSSPAVFWLDPNRAHDAEQIKKVERFLSTHDTGGLDIRTMSPIDAMRFTLGRSRAGQDTISVTGNVLRDYLTDLFPILELGTSAKMLSIVPLLNGGGLFETGAGGSAPKHVQQFLKDGHLRWDSLGEFCAIVASFEHFGEMHKNDKAKLLSETLDQAIGQHLENRREPSRRVNELDTRGSHFYIALYWAEALANQTQDPDLQARFTDVAQQLSANKDRIVKDLTDIQGQQVDIGGYYHPNVELSTNVMRPSITLNAIVDGI
jgi:isocitrate dehydrogenase